jgi:hypothetical protein
MAVRTTRGKRVRFALVAGLLAGCSQPVILPDADPGREASDTGWWCWNVAALPDPHRPEYEDGLSDHPCTPAELETACRYLGSLRSMAPGDLPFCAEAGG